MQVIYSLGSGRDFRPKRSQVYNNQSDWFSAQALADPQYLLYHVADPLILLVHPCLRNLHWRKVSAWGAIGAKKTLPEPRPIHHSIINTPNELVGVVNDNVVFGGSSDSIMVLEQRVAGTSVRQVPQKHRPGVNFLLPTHSQCQKNFSTP